MAFQREVEENMEMRIFIANWLHGALNLEEGVTPLIDAAYKLGLPRWSKGTPPP